MVASVSYAVAHAMFYKNKMVGGASMQFTVFGKKKNHICQTVWVDKKPSHRN